MNITPWVISLVITLLLIQAALKAQQRAEKSMTPEGSRMGVYLMAFFIVAALVFLLATVTLVSNG